MKKLSISIPVVLLLFLTGCLKDKPNVDLSNLGYITEISTASTNGTTDAPSGGLTFFDGATLDASIAGIDSVMFTVNVASDYPPTKDVPVTIAVNDAARTAYIATAAIQFKPFPSNAYSLTTTTGIIKAGHRLDTFWVVFNHANWDPTQSFMLPITITSATGTTVSGNMNTIYFHIIGNPLAGTYTREWIRFDPPNTIANPTYDITAAVQFIPVSPTTISIPSGAANMTYLLSFVNTNGVLSNFTVAFPDSGPGSASTAGITITGGPTIVTADPVNKVFDFHYTYNNSSGAPRDVTDNFKK